MTTRKRAFVPRGGKVSVELPKEPASETLKKQAQQERFKPGGVLLTEELDDLYVFRKGGIKIYDLGMKLNDHGTYDRILSSALIATIAANPHFSFDATNVKNWRRTFEALLLADPFGVDDGKPHRQRIPFAFQNAYVDAVEIVTDEKKFVLIGEDESRAFVNRLYTVSSPTPDHNEGWKQDNDSGVLKYKDTTSAKYGLQSILFYSCLYTHGGFRFTNVPDHTAADADSVPKLNEVTAIYLAPVIVRLGLTYRADDGFNPTYEALVVLKSFSEYHITPSIDGDVIAPDTITVLKQEIVDDGLYAAAVDHVNTYIIGAGHTLVSGTTFVLNPYFIMNDPLAGIIQTKSKDYYVWFNGSAIEDDISFPLFLGREPFVHGIFT